MGKHTSWSQHQRAARQRTALVPHGLAWRGHGMAQQPAVTESRALICGIATTAMAATGLAVLMLAWWVTHSLVAAPA